MTEDARLSIGFFGRKAKDDYFLFETGRITRP